MLLRNGHSVNIACNVTKPIDPELIQHGCRVHDLSFCRSPFSKDNWHGYKQLKEILLKNEYDVIHTHTPIASVLVRIACRRNKEIRVIYTAHGFHFYRGAPLWNWLFFYPVEKWLSRYTDVLITINEEDYNRAKKSFRAKKVQYVPGVGLDTKRLRYTIVDKVAKREELGVPVDSFVLLSVGELNDNKNHETIINALSKLNNRNLYYIICGQGPLEDYLADLAKRLGVEEQVRLLGYRTDVAEIYKVSDVFVFPSKREGLGMAALEAMASGLPIITSNVHGIADYSIDGKTGFSYKPCDADGFARGIYTLLSDSALVETIGEYNAKAVDKYDVSYIVDIMAKIYDELS